LLSKTQQSPCVPRQYVIAVMASNSLNAKSTFQTSALAHPARLRMLGLLRLEGPATATSLARRLGLNTGATSYHLRQLAQHGFIEEDAGRGNGRERWWRAAHQSTVTDSSALSTPEEHETHGAYVQAVGILYAEQLQRAVERHDLLPSPWRDAGTFSDWQLRLTPERAQGLRDRLVAVIEEYAEDADAAAATFVVNLNAYLHPDAVPERGQW